MSMSYSIENNDIDWNNQEANHNKSYKSSDLNYISYRNKKRVINPSIDRSRESRNNNKEYRKSQRNIKDSDSNNSSSDNNKNNYHLELTDDSIITGDDEDDQDDQDDHQQHINNLLTPNSRDDDNKTFEIENDSQCVKCNSYKLELNQFKGIGINNLSMDHLMNLEKINDR